MGSCSLADVLLLMIPLSLVAMVFRRQLVRMDPHIFSSRIGTLMSFTLVVLPLVLAIALYC